MPALPATRGLLLQPMAAHKAPRLSLPAEPRYVSQGHAETWTQQQPLRRDSCRCEARPAHRKVCKRCQQPVYILWLNQPFQRRCEAHQVIYDALSLQLSFSCLGDRNQHSVAKRAGNQAGRQTCKRKKVSA